MSRCRPRPMTRRLALAGLGTAVAAVLAAPIQACARATPLGYAFSGPALDRGLGLAPPLACTPGTRPQTEGPFYTPLTPRRSDLRKPDSGGAPLVLDGLVMASDCRPLAGAVIDIWHSDERGRYDNRGFRYRGHQFTDSTGAFRFMTVRPARYVGRTAHIHVKVQGEATRLLTTQLYFPDLAEANARDRLYRDDLAMRLERDGGGWRGRFDFIIATA